MTRRDFIVRLLAALGWMVFVPNSLAQGRAVDFERSRRGDHSVGFFTDHTQFVDQKLKLLNITKPDDSPVSLDTPLALRERGMGVRAERCNLVT
jgi:hypothetical protein